MARRRHRTGGAAQVTPDALLARRTGAPCSLDVPVSVMKEQGGVPLSLFPDVGRRSVFDEVGIELVLASKDPKAGAPRLVFDRKIYTVNAAKEDMKSPFSSTSVFTETSKMACPSFSLPAGPTTEAGTCPAANQSRKGGLREEGKVFVCSECYAFSLNYIFPNVALAQAARLMWVRRQVEEDPSGRMLGESFAAAIEDYARDATLCNAPDGVGQRLVIELGVKERGRLCVPVRLPSVSGYRRMPCSTPLPPESGFRDTDEWREANGVPEGAVCGFFRIHDSGDYGVLTKPSAWETYANAWKIAAESLPHVQFWVPTRMWMWDKLTACMGASPPNLSVRPSALSIDDDAPVVEGLVAGSAVFGKERMKMAQEEWTGDAGQTWPCPVYSQGGDAEKKSCMGSGCRACWLWKRTPVAYKWH